MTFFQSILMSKYKKTLKKIEDLKLDMQEQEE